MCRVVISSRFVERNLNSKAMLQVRNSKALELWTVIALRLAKPSCESRGFAINKHFLLLMWICMLIVISVKL